MTEYESELTGLEFVADVLQPIKLVVWGDLAIRYLGVPVVHQCYMLGVRDDEMDLAATKLADVGFIRQHWSFGSTIDPATRKDDKIFQRVHANIGLAFANLDAKTIRFHHPDENKFVQRTILIPSSYLHLSASECASTHEFTPPDPPSQPPFYVHGNLYYPNIVELLRSIIAVYLEEREHTNIQN
ncbi:hypothetical protein DL95DRAFT_396021 [Leptodontidium sp. 2 PMI_412]|nr:hypothetical protein DL95DRAFT_396021 [Leptodontidium sp. 2 PMI_412]